MKIDWIIVSQIAGPVIAIFVGAAINKFFSERERLIAFYGHIASHALDSVVEGKEVTRINTHTVIVRNSGRKTATNVRIRHSILPDFKVYPDIDYKIEGLPGGSKDIMIPRLAPKKEITISYIYFPPTTYNQISTAIESDAGAAKIVNVRLQQIYPQWFNLTVAIIMLAGIISIIYGIMELVKIII